MNKKIKNSKEAKQLPEEVKQLSDDELETVNSGMKIFVKEDMPSWFQSFLDLFFKTKP